MNGWPLAYFEGPASPAKRLAEIGPVADSRLLAKVPAKAANPLTTTFRPLEPVSRLCY
jgi:hypothetical protein